MTEPRLPITIRQIPPSQLSDLRHAILWPSIPIKSQLMPYDTEPTTRHLGAFISASTDSIESQNLDPKYLPGTSQQPIGILTLTVEGYLPTTPISLTLVPERQVQLHRFAVLTQLQGQGIGRQMYHAALDMLHSDGEFTLLHLNARTPQKGVYERWGLQILDDTVRIRRGPGDAGPPLKYIRMGVIVYPGDQ